MRPIPVLTACLTLLAAGTPATAQIAGPLAYGRPSLADQQRDRMEMVRLRSAEQAAFARQQRLEARLTELELRAARRPEPFIAQAAPALRSTETERQARQAATARREATVAGVTQIDDWLDGRPR